MGLAWDPDVNPPGTSYVVQLSTDDVNFSNVVTTTFTATVVTGLTRSTTYFFQVSAAGAPSNVLSLTTISAEETFANGQNGCNVLGQATFTTALAATTAGGLNNVQAPGYDLLRSRLFVADRNNNRVLVFDLSGGITNGMSAAFVLGQSDFTSNFPATSASGMRGPTGISHDIVGSRLFVADNGNNRVLMYDISSGITNGMNATRVLGQNNFLIGTPGLSRNEFNAPRNIHYSAALQDLFVADTVNNRILVFDASRNVVNGENAKDVLGQANFNSNTPATTQSGMSLPYDVNYDFVNQRLFVADRFNSRVLIFDLSRAVNNGMAANFVLGQAGFTSGTAAVTQAGMSSPSGVAFDPSSSRLFVSDQNSNRVLIFDLSSGITNGMNATIVLGQTDFISGDPATTQSGLNSPVGSYFDSSNRSLYVAEPGNNRVMVFNQKAGPGLANPSFVAVTSSTVNAQWASVIDATGYTLVASTVNANPPLVSASVSAAGTAATVSGLTPRTTYYLFSNATGNTCGLPTPYTFIGSTVTLVGEPIIGPNRGILAASTQTITAAWDLSIGATSYTLVASTTSTNPPTLIAASSSTVLSTATLSGLVPNTTYFLFVNACAAGVCSVYTAFSSTATLANAPALPSTFSLVGPASLTVSFGANNNPAGTSYTTQISSNPTFIPILNSSITTLTQAAFTGLTPNTTYFLRALATNFSGIASTFTVLGSTRTTAAAPPGAGIILAVSTNTIRAAWNLSAGATSYTLVASTTSTNPPTSIAASSSTALSTATVSGLVPNTTYFLFVNACAEGPCYSYTALGSTITLANAPALPSTFSAVSPLGLTISFGANNNPAGTSYTVQISTSPAFVPILNSSVTVLTQATFTSLIPHTTYYLQSRAMNFAGTPSAFTNPGIDGDRDRRRRLWPLEQSWPLRPARSRPHGIYPRAPRATPWSYRRLPQILPQALRRPATRRSARQQFRG